MQRHFALCLWLSSFPACELSCRPGPSKATSTDFEEPPRTKPADVDCEDTIVETLQLLHCRDVLAGSCRTSAGDLMIVVDSSARHSLVGSSGRCVVRERSDAGLLALHVERNDSPSADAGILRFQVGVAPRNGPQGATVMCGYCQVRVENKVGGLGSEATCSGAEVRRVLVNHAAQRE